MPFKIFCASATVASSISHVLSPPLLDILRHFVPDLCDSNLSMKHSLQLDSASASMLLRNVRVLNAALLVIKKLQDMFLVVAKMLH